MGLISFLKEQGFIAKDEGTATVAGSGTTATPMAPVIFPAQSAATQSSSEPSFVQDLPAASHSAGEAIDPAFVKFYEDEIARVNQPGPDYYEFRQQMITMNQKMANKGVSPELILQTVLASFDAQNIPAAKLAEAARFYKDALSNKKDSFLKGAASEKDNQLQKRSGALAAHQNSIDNINRQLADLQKQMESLQQTLAKEKTQMEVDKTMGKEGIEKIERAERQITLAYNFMVGNIDKDITLLQSS